MTDASRWRLSASVIIAAKDENESDLYKVLMLKRTDSTAMVQNQTVFPGGLVEAEADENVAWLQYLEEFGVSQASLRRLIPAGDDRPSIFAPQGTGCYDRFFKRSKIWSREITLRLTALRECFEEVGILLCRTRAQLEQSDDGVGNFMENFDRAAWQRRVHDKPMEFLELCRHLKVVPDLWALHEWAAWATPAVFKKVHDTAFFIAFVERQPSVLGELTEVKECMWQTPREFLSLLKLREIWFAPPQMYEVCRLANISDYEELLVFSRERSKLGSTLILPIYYMCSDAAVSVLPGDDDYVKEPRLASDFIPFDGTAAEFRAKAVQLHRYEAMNNLSAKFYLTFPPPNGHLSPAKWSNKL